MNRHHIRHLLDRIGLIRHPCDLDLLLFFARHPRTLATSEQIAAWLGHELRQIATSLDKLLEAGLLTRTQNPTHAARLYVFSIGGSHGGWLPSLLELASTRPGRVAIIQALGPEPGEAGDPVAHDRQPAPTRHPRPFLVPRTPDLKPGPRTKAG